MEVEQIIVRATHIIRQHVDPKTSIVLFGSWATGNALQTSDIDIGIQSKRPIDPIVLADIRQGLDELPTLRKIDVVDLSSTSKRFRQHALEKARSL